MTLVSPAPRRPSQRPAAHPATRSTPGTTIPGTTLPGTTTSQAVGTTAPGATAPGTTAPGRDRAVDLVRAACLVAVVAMHALMVGIGIRDGEVVLENALESWGGFTVFSWVTQMMPLFFILGGFASATQLRRGRARGVGTAAYLGTRMRRLLPVPLAAAIAVVATLTALSAAGLPPELVGEAGWRISQPLWFLGVYVLCTACAPLCLRLHERAPAAALVALGIGIVAVDAVRAASGVEAIGFVNLLLVWLFAQQLGFWLADGRAPSLRVAGWAIAGIAALVLLGLSPANLYAALNPPTAALALLGVAQLALFARLRPMLAAWAESPRVRRCSDALNGAAMTIYAWHMPVVVLLAGATLAVGSLGGGAAALIPEPLSAAWWLGRPAWLLAAGLAVAAVVPAVRRWERRPTAGSGGANDVRAAGRSDLTGGGSPRPWRVAAAVLCGAGGVLAVLAGGGALWAWALGAILLAAGARSAAAPRSAHSVTAP